MRLASRSFRAIAIVPARAGMPLFAGSAAMVGEPTDRFAGTWSLPAKRTLLAPPRLVPPGWRAGSTRNTARRFLPSRRRSSPVEKIPRPTTSYGSTQTTPPAQNPSSLASLGFSTRELAEKLQSSFENSDLTLFALVRMLRGRKLRGLLSEDSGARVAYIS